MDNAGDQADPNDLKKGSNLILKKLEDQIAHKQVDPDLLKSMGWTEEDARKFYQRLKQEQQATEDAAPLKREQRRQFGQGTDCAKARAKVPGTKRTQFRNSTPVGGLPYHPKFARDLKLI